MSKAEQDVVNHLRDVVLSTYMGWLWVFGFSEKIIWRYTDVLRDLVEGIVAEYVSDDALLELYSGMLLEQLWTEELDVIVDGYVSERMIGWREFVTEYIADMEELL